MHDTYFVNILFISVVTRVEMQIGQMANLDKFGV